MGNNRIWLNYGVDADNKLISIGDAAAIASVAVEVARKVIAVVHSICECTTGLSD